MLVAHGMGQQVPFETLDGVARALRGHAVRRGDDPPDVTVRMLRFDDEPVPRAELKLKDAQGRDRDVHLFEGYWAPLAEGQITLLQTMTFLAGAGWAGLVHSMQGCFHRFMFGRNQRLSVGPRAGVAFVAALAVMLGISALSGAVTTVALVRLMSGGQSPWPDPRLFVDLSMDVISFLASVGIAALGVGLARRGRRASPDGGFRVPGRLTIATAWALIWLAVPLIVGCGALVVVHVFIHRCPGVEHALWCAWPPFRACAVLFARACPPGLLTLAAIALWGAVLAVTAAAREVIIQFAGDVAIYVSSHAVNRFQKSRDEIKQAVFKVARCVYEWIEPGETTPGYDRIIIVGHSLGSVIAYDALNAMLRTDEREGRALSVEERTSMLLTFGSPLDKTAFLFRNQRDAASDVREALAAAVQPLIRDYASRPRRWVNLWSPADWIGAELTYYDDTHGSGGNRRIDNRPDPDATTPLLAHSEHWDGRLLAQVLFDEATR